MKLTDIKRIRKEDFDNKYSDLIDKLGYIFNSFAEQVSNILDNNIDFQNLNMQIISVDIITDSSGDLVNPPSIRTTLNSKIQGLICIKADNLSAPGTYPTSQPFVSFNIVNSSLITILNVSGLQNSSTYRLKLLLIG